MRDVLTVSGTRRADHDDVGVDDLAEPDDPDRAGGAGGDHLLQVHLVRARHPGAPVDERDRRTAPSRSSRLKASEAPTPPPPPTMAIRVVM